MRKILGRSWAFVMYPDSMPSNWEQIIIDSGLPVAISPLHDKDINPDGVGKKPHYHVICYYENPTTLKNVKENFCDKLNATIPIKLENMRGMYRYHIHIDNPEKYQYDDRERKFFNGFDTSIVDSLSKTEIDKKLKEIHQFINDNDIREYIDLLDILKDNGLTDLYNVAINKTIFLNSLLSSKRNKEKQKNASRIKKSSSLLDSKNTL